MALNGEDADLGGQDPQQQVPLEVNSTIGLGLPCPERFNGQEDQFEDFAYSLRSYLTMSNPSFYDVMKAIEGSQSRVLTQQLPSSGEI